MKISLYKKRAKLLMLLFLFISTLTFAQTRTTVTGTVLSAEDNSPLPGASIVEKGTTNGTSTDFDGKFTLNVASSDAKLIISFIGYKTQEVAVSDTSLTIIMETDASALEEVVVTALGLKREQRALGYAVQEISGEDLQKVQGIDVATSLTGKVAGVLVKNPTDFNTTPKINILGEEEILIVIDGIAYDNKTLNDIAPEDIESISTLKGPTGSALYGNRGRNGVVLITTKNGSEGKTGISVDFTTNTMFTAGYLAIPEKQSVYGRGENNTYDLTKDQSWGGVMDGSIQTQWDPIAKEFRDYPYLPVGKDNFKNFLEQGYITNNNINVTFKENTVALRSSLNWTQNKGRYPNSTLDKYTYTLSGDINLDRFKLTSNLSYARRYTPNMGSNGYTSYDPMYTLLVNSSSDFDVRDYKDYWLIPGVLQNNHFGYDIENDIYSGKNQNNPYYDRYERINEVTRDIFNADITMSYEITDWLKATVRSGLDFYGDIGKLKLSQGSYTSLGDTGIPYFTYRSGLTFNGSRTGAYLVGKTTGFSVNSDLLLTGTKKFVDDKFELEYLAGGTIFYSTDENMNATTVGGISVPGFFSLAASVNPATVAEERRERQINSAFGRLALSWNRLIYLDFTGRNDWSSTLAGPGVPDSKRSYFYPSISGSFIVSELMPESTKDWLDLLKVRGSWTQEKKPADPYEINSVYTSASSIWNDVSGTYSPSLLYDIANVLPSASDTYEVGLQGMFYKKRLTADIAYSSRRFYDALVNGPISPASGVTGIKINTDEEQTKRSWIVELAGTPIQKEDLQWDLGINWSTYKTVYTKLDPIYSQNRPWIKVGERVDPYVIRTFRRVPSGEYAGQYVLTNSGKLDRENFSSVIGYQNPDWIWGINTTLRYKNWSLFASLDGVKGGMIKSVTENYMWIQGVHPDSTTPERALDAATPGSMNYLIPGVTATGTYITDSSTGEVIEDTRVFTPNTTYVTYKDYIRSAHLGTQWGGTGTEDDILDGTFFKLREISLTYTVPSTILDKWGPVKNASISFIGQNVFLWAKDFRYSDPDGGSENFADPSSRYIGTNIKLSF